VSLALVAVTYVAGDVWGRLVVQPVGRFFPERKEAVVSRHVRGMRSATLWILRNIGRARIDTAPRIPCRSGVLIVMNHQSLIDILVASEMVADGYPRYVTHYRYATGIPLISHMIRMMGSIPVYPGQMGKEQLEHLAETGRTAEHPIVLYPEGHRTKDGEIRPWKRGALDAFLSARDWTVHVVVLDGLWQAARIPDFVGNLTRVRCRVESAGVFEYDGRGRASHDEFVERIRAAMCDKLSEMRRASRDMSERPRGGTRAA
jgi:1-acyl-sn-glycerol-3-phosphate acyltransferase